MGQMSYGSIAQEPDDRILVNVVTISCRNLWIFSSHERGSHGFVLCVAAATL
jgi:hypothetical protein